jgi:Tfp pilus assembly protein PilF
MSESEGPGPVQSAQSLLDEGRSADARRILEEYLPENPDDADAHFLLAVTLHDACEVAGAVNHFQAFLRIRPEVAEVQFLRTLELEPEMVPALNNLGLLCKEARELTQAKEYLEKAVALNPKYSPATVNLGLVLMELREAELLSAAALLPPADAVEDSGN